MTTTRMATFWWRMWVPALVLTALALIAGAYTYTSLIPRDGFPPLQLGVMTIDAEHALASPAVADERLAAPLSEAVLAVDGVAGISTATSANTLTAIVQLDSGVEGKDLQEELQAIANRQVATGATVVPLSLDTAGFTLVASAPDMASEPLQATVDRVAERLNASDDVLSAQAERQTAGDGRRTSFSRVGTRGPDGTFSSAPALSIILQKPEDLDALTFSDRVGEVLDEMSHQGTLPSEVSITRVGDQAEQTRAQISDLERSLLISLAAVCVIVLLLIGWRAALLSVVFIPTVMATTVLVLHLMGVTLNTVSMFGLLLVLGLFIDDVIVVVEALDRELAEGHRGVTAIAQALRRIAVADLMGSLTTIAVFVPLLFVPGILGEFIRELPLAVIVALTISVVFALTLFVGLAAGLMRGGTSGGPLDRALRPVSGALSPVVAAIGRGLHRFVAGYVGRRARTLLVGVAGILAVVVGLSYMSSLDLDIFPQPEDAPTVSLEARFASTGNVVQAERAADDVIDTIAARYGDQIESYAFVGGSRDGAQLDLTLSDDRSLDAGQVSAGVVDLFADTPDVALAPAGEAETLDIRLVVDSPNQLDVLARTAPTFLTAQTEVDVATVAPPREIVQRTDGTLSMQANITLRPDADADTFRQALPQRIAADGLGVGMTAAAVDADDALEQSQQESLGAMGMVFVLSIFVIGLLLAVQFRSLLLPGLILVAIPLSLPLIAPGLLAVGTDLSFFVLLGLATLIGIVVNNGILLVDYANQEVQAGVRPAQAILNAHAARFRPLATTTLTTIVGVIPLTQDVQFAGLAWTVIFGLLSSTVLVATVFPAYYMWVQGPRSALSNRLRRGKAPSAG